MPTSLLVAFLVGRARESTGGDSEPFIRQNGATRGRIRIILRQSADRHTQSSLDPHHHQHRCHRSTNRGISHCPRNGAGCVGRGG